MSAVEGRELWLQRRGREGGRGGRWAHKGMHKENVSPKPLACKMRKMRRAEFRVLQPVGLKHEV